MKIMEVLVLDGKSFVKASKAAKDLGYATDYVGQLCRSGKVEAHLIGRTWYVNQDQLGTHRVEKKRISRIKAREYAKKSIEEHRIKVQESSDVQKSIRYESDGNELIPKTRKLNVQTEHHRADEDENDVDNTTEILNEGNKVLMSGSVEVIDVTDGPIESDTFVLSPGRIRNTRIEVRNKKKTQEATTVTVQAQDLEEGNNMTEIGQIDPIEAILEENETVNLKIDSIDKNIVQSSAPEIVNQEDTNKKSLLGYLATVIAVLLLVLSTFPLYLSITYSVGNSKASSVKILFSFEKIIDKIDFKI